MRITSKGQVTIPQLIREQTGLLPNTDVEFQVDGERVLLLKSRGRRPARGVMAVDRLRGAASTALTTDEIMALTRSD